MEIPLLSFTNSKTGESFTAPFELPRGRKENRWRKMRIFSIYLEHLQGMIGFKLSARGWCYQLEGFGLIDKGEFNKVQRAINDCRKMGFLPIDFVASEEARSFSGVEIPDTRTPEEHFKSWLKSALNCEDYYTPDWWDGEEYYIQMLVEKIDLVTLFKPVCELYHIPIASSKGWSSILQRWDILKRFKAAEEDGLKPVLLYCGDHDPYGLAISDYLRKNFNDLYLATKYRIDDLVIDRFGLNYDFIEENNLTWIDNLISGSGKKPDYNDPIIRDYVSKYGERKCEANALVVNPESAQELCYNAIEHYLGSEAVDRFENKFEEVKEKIRKYVESTGLKEVCSKILKELDEVK